MSASRYRLFMKLCQEWKLDESKVGRDLGYVIRQNVAKEFKNGETTSINEEECANSYNALQKLSIDYYRSKYPFTRETGTAELTLKECSEVVSTDSLKYLHEQNLGLVQKAKHYIKGSQGK